MPVRRARGDEQHISLLERPLPPLLHGAAASGMEGEHGVVVGHGGMGGLGFGGAPMDDEEGPTVALAVLGADLLRHRCPGARARSISSWQSPRATIAGAPLGHG